MPRVRKTRTKGKDVKNEPQKEERPQEENKSQKEELKNQIILNNCPGPVYINYYSTESKKVATPSLGNHWTKNPLDNRWLHLWHYNQELIKLESKFVQTADWKLFPQINHLFTAKKELLESGKIIDNTPLNEIVDLYYTGEPQVVRNRNTNFFQNTFYKFADIPEEGEIIEEISRSNTIKGRKPVKEDDELFY